MTRSIAELFWLAPPPADFAARCAAAAEAPASVGAEIGRLAAYALDGRQSRRLGRTLAKVRRTGLDMTPLSPLSLVVLSNATMDFAADYLPAAAARHGVSLDLVLPPFDQPMQQALDPASETCRAGADAVLLALDQEWFGLGDPALDAAGGAVERATERLAALMDALAAHTSATPIVCTVANTAPALFGSLDVRTRGTPRALVDSLNTAILALAADRGALVLDTRALAEQVGVEHWRDPVQYFAYKLPFASAQAAIWADWVGRLLGAVRGRARKCLVLDLDNTLWGGVVGDDGVSALVLGPGSPRGESFLAVQRLALALRARGVILAVSTKNDDAVARSAFEGHPEMALRLSDIAVFQANWLDKPSNLEAIAGALNIGLDALVLLDDNPAERAQVRAALPGVAVPELPADPAWFAPTLAAAGYFEAVTFSEEDRLRAASYAHDARRAEVKAQARDLGDYLVSLDMTLAASAFDAIGRSRIAQLINKTNQFNLTTRRYGEAEVAGFEADPAVLTLQVRLADRFGDLGMIGVVIAEMAEGDDGAREARVDTWLMSCRVLGRRVEEAMLSLLAEQASAARAARITARYLPTAKNGMVRDLMDRLGFALVEEDSAGGRSYVLDLSTYAAPVLPMRIDRPVAAR